MSSSNLMRWSGLAALVGGGLLIISDVLNGALFPGEPGSQVMTTSSWFLVQIVGLVALILISLGLVGLYARQAEVTGTLGLIAFVVAFCGTVMAFGFLWGEPFLGPMLAKQAPDVLDIEPTGVLVGGIILTFGLFALGWLLFGLASLRAGLLPRGAAILLMIGGVLYVLGFADVPFVGVVFDVAVAWLGYGLWSGTAGEAARMAEAPA